MNTQPSQELIDQYRYINVEHDEWWDCIYDDWKEKLADVGVRVDDIWFSGFSCQGDGACFEGCIEDFSLFMEKHLLVEDYPFPYAFEKHGGDVSCSAKHSGHYYHAYSTDISVEVEDTYIDGDTEDLKEITLLALEEQFSLQDFEKTVTEILRDYMKDIYTDLEKEYDYLSSEEAVLESLVANGITD